MPQIERNFVWNRRWKTVVLVFSPVPLALFEFWIAPPMLRLTFLSLKSKPGDMVTGMDFTLTEVLPLP